MCVCVWGGGTGMGARVWDGVGREVPPWAALTRGVVGWWHHTMPLTHSQRAIPHPLSPSPGQAKKRTRKVASVPKHAAQEHAVQIKIDVHAESESPTSRLQRTQG